MRVAITGSSGLIGTALRRSLDADGPQVIRVLRGDVPDDAVRWDVDRDLIDSAALDGVDAVVHLAGAGIGDKRWTVDQKRAVLESRTKGTALLAGALATLAAPPRVLVSGSAIGFYGDRGDEVLTEASAPGTGFLAEVATAWEDAAAPAEAAGIRVARLRTGIVLAREGGALARMASIARFGLLGRIGSGRQWMSWISLDDEVRAIRFLLDHDLNGPVNATSPNPATNAELTRTLGRVLKRPTILPIPAFGPKLLLGAELASALLLEGQRVQPAALVEAGFEFRHTELEPTLRAILRPAG